MHVILILLVNILVVLPATGMDFVRLRDGRVVEGAVIRQDTLAVYLAPWDQRHLRQPDMEVFGRSEVESVWLGAPPHESAARPYTLHSGLLEIGGGLSFQTWAASVHERRYLMQFSVQSGYAITKYLGTEIAADFSAPFAHKTDKDYDALRFGYQVALHVVGTLDMGSSWIPFAYVGGGGALEVPRAGLVETTSDDARSLIDVGIGVKSGWNGLGLRAEVRHAYYTWTPDVAVAEEVRSTGQNADATTLRVSLFTYF
ncbi:MAG: hypothetical protein IPK53_06275 [bacterium]|nr:hypothetical protein [bacterium]MBK8128560.1 hypothetical protein [bacterium]